jgi:SOS-response transcriptional repressor LexA
MTVIGDMKRRLIVEAIQGSIDNLGFQPTRRELATMLGYTTPSAVQFHLRKLERAGVIAIDAKGRISINGAAGQDGAGSENQ